eukprot:1937432-Ditylum_brightwellii.AAC.1
MLNWRTSEKTEETVFKLNEENKEDDVQSASERENESKNSPVQSTTRSEHPARIPRYLTDNYNLDDEYAEIALTPVEE